MATPAGKLPSKPGANATTAAAACAQVGLGSPVMICANFSDADPAAGVNTPVGQNPTEFDPPAAALIAESWLFDSERCCEAGARNEVPQTPWMVTPSIGA